MRNLLNTFICILLTSPLAALDIGLEGVEFGVLQLGAAEIHSYQTTVDGDNVFNDVELVLNEGDILQILRFDTGSQKLTYGAPNSGGGTYLTAYVYSESNGITSKEKDRGSFIVGPTVLKLGFYRTPDYNSSIQTLSPNEEYYIQLDYAILRAGASTQSSYVTIPANSSGNFEVKLQTSSDLQTWSPTTPGIFPYGDNAKFFRLVVE